MRVIVTFDLPDSAEYTAQDVEEALEARLDEFYPSNDGGVAVPENVRVKAAETPAISHLLDAAEVGLEGSDDAHADEAWAIVSHLRG